MRSHMASELPQRCGNVTLQTAISIYFTVTTLLLSFNDFVVAS